MPVRCTWPCASVEQMARSFEDLIGWLGRDNSFPNGAFLLTGTASGDQGPDTNEARHRSYYE